MFDITRDELRECGIAYDQGKRNVTYHPIPENGLKGEWVTVGRRQVGGCSTPSILRIQVGAVVCQSLSTKYR